MANQFDVINILRNNSTAKWVDNENYVLLKGEPGIEFLVDGSIRMKIGDGVSPWKSLKYACGSQQKTFQLEIPYGSEHLAAIEKEIDGFCVSSGDVAVVKEKLDGKYFYTAYVYDGVQWVAMNGNYNAKNIYFDENLVFTKSLGAIEVPEGQSVIVPTKGRSFLDLITLLTRKVIQGEQKLAPRIIFELSDSGYVEVGELITPKFKVTLFPGEYTMGPEDTGVSAITWEVNASSGKCWETNSGEDEQVTVTDNFDYYLTATVEHTAGVKALTNEGKNGFFSFGSGTITQTSEHIKGYRKLFHGATKEEFEPVSDIIRSLAHSTPTDKVTGKYVSGNGFLINVPEGSKQITIALYNKKLIKVVDTNSFGADIVNSFELFTDIPVAGANSYTSLNYNVYVYRPVGGLNETVLECLIEDCED